MVKWGFFLAALWVFSCKEKIHYHPALPLHGSYTSYEEIISSSKIAEVEVEAEKEKTGTAFEIHTTVTVTPQENGTRVQWEPSTFLSNGWNKTLLARVHQRKLKLAAEIDKQGNLLSLTGFDRLPEILKKVKQDEPLRKRLLDRMDTARYKNEWWDRWVLSTFLPPGEYAAGTRVDPELVNSRLKTIKVDSISIRGERNSRNHPCLEYSVHYLKKDYFNIEMEEFVVVHKKNLLSSSRTAQISKLQIQSQDFMRKHPTYGEIAKPNLVDNIEVSGTWRFSLSTSTGFPCYEFKKEEANVVLSDNISNRINVTFFRTHEIGYKSN